VLKDRLYTYPARSVERRAARTVLYRLALDLCRLMAPVLSFTAEEIWQEIESLHGRDKWADATVHAQSFPAPLEVPVDEALLDRWERLGTLREEIARALEEARRAKRIGTALQADLCIEAGEQDRAFLESFGDDLRFLLIVSSVAFGDAGEDAVASDRVPGLRVAVRQAAGDKCPRCWHYTTDVGSHSDFPALCARCALHVAEILTARESA
jgi:isoleucyl-tRNA synthetase